MTKTQKNFKKQMGELERKGQMPNNYRAKWNHVRIKERKEKKSSLGCAIAVILFIIIPPIVLLTFIASASIYSYLHGGNPTVIESLGYISFYSLFTIPFLLLLLLFLNLKNKKAKHFTVSALILDTLEKDKIKVIHENRAHPGTVIAKYKGKKYEATYDISSGSYCLVNKNVKPFKKIRCPFCGQKI
jgi:uncharacterized paraquat-inducible protein A